MIGRALWATPRLAHNHKLAVKQHQGRRMTKATQDSSTTSHTPKRTGRPSPRERREDAAAESYPLDSTSMSTPPPSREAREASEAVGSPQAATRQAGPSPPNKTGAAPAPPTAPAWKSSARPNKETPSTPSPATVPESHPAKETLKTLEASTDAKGAATKAPKNQGSKA